MNEQRAHVGLFVMPQAEKQEPIKRVAAKSSDPSTLNTFISSLVSTVWAVTVCSPFDVLKTRYQVQHDKKVNSNMYSNVFRSFNKIVKNEGIKGLFRGYKATLMTTPIFHSIYFPVYENLRVKLSNELHAQKSDFKVVWISSALTGVLCNVITNPLWLVRVRMQSEVFRGTSHQMYKKKYGNVFKAIYRIYQREGFFALYTGLAASMMGISHVAIYFPMYEQFKTYFKTNYDTKNDGHLSSKFILCSSISAKILTSMITYPHEVIRARQQDTRLNDNQNRNVMQVIRRTYRNGGLKSFYHGFSLNMMRMLPQNAILFLLYEYLS